MGDLKSEQDYDEKGCSSTGGRRASSVVKWDHGTGTGSWQGKAKSVRSRTAHLFNNPEMSDVSILSVDENWWFGATVKDFSAHKFLLATASPVLNKIINEWEDEEEVEEEDAAGSDPAKERRMCLDPLLEVTVTLSKSYFTDKIEWEGIPPIAAEAVLEYIYKDKFNDEDFENGYSRNLLWRIWHASRAFEMEHLSEKCAMTLDRTMCEDTVFWDLNYSMKYKDLVTGDILTRVLKMIDEMEVRLFEHENFVWLDHGAVVEALSHRRPASCDPMVVYNNLLRWSLYQLDRNACLEVDDKTGNDIPIQERLNWIRRCTEGVFDDHLNRGDLCKYLDRGLERMPWSELSQKDFLEHVVKFQDSCSCSCSSSSGSSDDNGGRTPQKILLSPDHLVAHSVRIMEEAVRNPDRLFKSAYHANSTSSSADKSKSTVASGKDSPKMASLFTRRDTVKVKTRPTLTSVSNSISTTADTKGV